MAIGGEINGTTCLVFKGAAGAEELVGQMEFTVTYGGTPIDVSNKSAGDWVCLLDGELAAKQVVFAGTLTYNNSAVYEAVKSEAYIGKQDEYTFKFLPSTEALTGNFVPNAMTDTAPHGAAVSTAITLSSSGAVTRTAQTITP